MQACFLSEAPQLPGVKLNAPSQEFHHPCFVSVSLLLWGFPCGSVVKDCLQFRGCGFDFWVGNIPWRRKWQPTPVFLPGKSHGQRSLGDCSPWGGKEWDTTEHFTSLLFPSHLPHPLNPQDHWTIPPSWAEAVSCFTAVSALLISVPSLPLRKCPMNTVEWMDG